MKQIRIFIVDDNTAFRKAMHLMLSKRSYIIRIEEAKDGKECIELLNKNKPDIILMDVVMPVMDGIEATKAVIKLYPKQRIIALTTFHEYEFIASMFDAGACGYLRKDTVNENIDEAIKLALAGQTFYFNT